MKHSKILFSILVLASVLIYLFALPSAYKPDNTPYMEKPGSKVYGENNVDIEIKGNTYYYESNISISEDIPPIQNDVPTFFGIMRNRTSLNFESRSNAVPEVSKKTVYPAFWIGLEPNSPSFRYDPNYTGFGEKNDYYYHSYVVPGKVSCHPSIWGVTRYISTDLTFPFQECGLNSDITRNMNFNYTVSTTVTFPDNLDIVKEWSYVACTSDVSVEEVSEKVSLKNEDKKVAVFESQLSPANKGVCQLQVLFVPSNLYRFVFWVALISSYIGFYYFRDENWVEALGISIAIWTFQEALIPLSGLERHLKVTLFDIAVFLGIGLAEANYRWNILTFSDLKDIKSYLEKSLTGIYRRITES